MKNLMAGKSGISKITAFDTSQYDRHYGGEVKNFEAKKFISKHKLKTLGRASQMAIAAAKLALKDGKLKFTDRAREKMAVCVGTTTGEIGSLEKFNKYSSRNVREQFRMNTISFFSANSISSNIAREFKIMGPNFVFGTACSSGNYAVGKAYDLIRTGKQDYVLAGGADGFSRIVFTGFCRTYAVAPEKCQPFDKNRKGIIPAEGSGMLLLESLGSAKARKAKIYAEVLGAGYSCDAKNMTEPSPDGIAEAIRKSLVSAKVRLNEVDYISAHGTGTKENDQAEAEAINRVFGKEPKNIRSEERRVGTESR